MKFNLMKLFTTFTTAIITIFIIIVIIIIIIIELTHSKIIQENTVEIDPQPAALDFKNLSQYSSRSSELVLFLL